MDPDVKSLGAGVVASSSDPESSSMVGSCRTGVSLIHDVGDGLIIGCLGPVITLLLVWPLLVPGEAHVMDELCSLLSYSAIFSALRYSDKWLSYSTNCLLLDNLELIFTNKSITAARLGSLSS